MAATIRLDIVTAGPEERIDIAVFIRALDSARIMLSEIDQVIVGGKFRWSLTHLEVGSGIFVAEGEWATAEDALKALGSGELTAKERLVEAAFIGGLASLDAAATWPETFSRTALRAASDLASLKSDDILSIMVTSPNVDDRVSVTERVRANVDELIGPTTMMVGSVIGQVQRISLVNKTPEFWVRDEASGLLVSCPFRLRDIERIRDMVGRRVLVTGEMHYNRQGDLRRAHRIDEIRVLSADPVDVLKVLGIAPNFTEGMESDEYIRENW